jgi:hypothetical protein
VSLWVAIALALGFLSVLVLAVFGAWVLLSNAEFVARRAPRDLPPATARQLERARKAARAHLHVVPRAASDFDKDAL